MRTLDGIGGPVNGIRCRQCGKPIVGTCFLGSDEVTLLSGKPGRVSYSFCDSKCANAWAQYQVATSPDETEPVSLKTITETCRLHRSILFCPLCKNVLAAPLAIGPGYVRPKCRGVPDRQHPELKMMLMQCVRTQEDLDAESLACE